MNQHTEPHAIEDSVDRRTFLTLGALIVAGMSLPAKAEDDTLEGHMRMMSSLPADAPKIAMLVYPNMVALDLIGPLTVFKITRFDIHLVWKNKMPVGTDVGISMTANQTFEECPRDLDILFVPGGITGTTACMQD